MHSGIDLALYPSRSIKTEIIKMITWDYYFRENGEKHYFIKDFYNETNEKPEPLKETEKSIEEQLEAIL